MSIYHTFTKCVVRAWYCFSVIILVEIFAGNVAQPQKMEQYAQEMVTYPP